MMWQLPDCSRSNFALVPHIEFQQMLSMRRISNFKYTIKGLARWSRSFFIVFQISYPGSKSQVAETMAVGFQRTTTEKLCVSKSLLEAPDIVYIIYLLLYFKQTTVNGVI